MIKADDLYKTIEDLNETRQCTFAEFIDKLFRGKFIEIYLGDSYEQVSTEQISVSYPAVFCGKVLGAYKEVLIINSAFVEKKTKSMKLGNIVFINERGIRALNEVDNVGSLDELFLKSSETLKILDTLDK